MHTEVATTRSFPGQYYDAETGHSYNYNRDYDPSTGRYIESDPIGIKGGLDTYVYVDDNPINDWDQFGLAPGGPYHPPAGVSLKCTGDDSCPMLKAKMWLLMRMIQSHQLWDWINPPPRGGGRHAQEIADLWRAYANCQSLQAKVCKSCPPPPPGTPVPLPEWPPVTNPDMVPIEPFEPMMPLEPIPVL